MRSLPTRPVFFVAVCALVLTGCAPARQVAPLAPTGLDTGQARTVVVDARTDWLDTGIQVRKNEVYRVVTRGSWAASPFCGLTGAEGLAAEHLMCMKGIFASEFPVPAGKIGALVGKIGANGTPFVIGGTQGFIADADGSLMLIMNDPQGFMFDNTGQIEAAIQRYQEGSASVPFAPPERASSRASLPPTGRFSGPRQYGAGFYAAERDIAFNVLETVTFDPVRREVTVAGHFDPKYPGRRIPYLQHLATLLDNPDPRVSLDWTPDFEHRVDALFRRMDSETEMGNLVGAGQLLGRDGKLTPKGKLLLPLFGVAAHSHGNAAGSLGADTVYHDLGQVRVTRVIAGSAADRAGLKAGDIIDRVTLEDGKFVQPQAPVTLYRTVRYAGAGARIKLGIVGRRNDPLQVTLDAYPGDPWEHVSKYDIKAKIFRAGERSDIANVLESLDRMNRLKDTKAGLNSMWILLHVTGVAEEAERNRQLVFKGRISKAEAMTRLSRLIAKGMEQAMHLPRGTMLNAYDNARRRGRDGWAALDISVLALNRALEPVMKDSLRKALQRNEQVTMPVALLDPAANFSPTVKPRYIGVPPDSELARVLIEADYVGKAILHKPDLAKLVPAYRTEYTFASDRPAVAESTNRLWITPGRIDVRRSPDNGAIRFGKADMRFNVGRSIGGGNEHRDAAYGRFLSGLYDDLSGVFPPLHELREASKLRVAAKWIRTRAPDFSLPREGRTRLTPPQTLEGFVTLIWSPKRAKVSLIAPGGIDFNVPPIGPSGPVFPDGGTVNMPVDASVADFRDDVSGEMPRIDPSWFSSTQSGRPYLPLRYRRPLTEPPVPPSTRLVALAEKGVRAGRRIDALMARIPIDPSRCEAEQARQLADKLDTAARVAQRLAGVEKALNAITSQLPERRKVRAEADKIIAEQEQRLWDNAADLATGGLLGVYDELSGSGGMRSIHDLESLIATMKQAKEKLGAIKGKLDNLDLAISSTMASSLNERERAQKDLLIYIRDTLAEGAQLTGNDAVTRALRTTGKAIGVASSVEKGLDEVENLYRVAGAMEALDRLNTQSEQEVRGLRDTLLPLQRSLSDRLATAMNDPLVKALETGAAGFDCVGKVADGNS